MWLTKKKVPKKISKKKKIYKKRKPKKRMDKKEVQNCKCGKCGNIIPFKENAECPFCDADGS